jgi:hypothetical protein
MTVATYEWTIDTIKRSLLVFLVDKIWTKY